MPDEVFPNLTGNIWQLTMIEAHLKVCQARLHSIVVSGSSKIIASAIASLDPHVAPRIDIADPNYSRDMSREVRRTLVCVAGRAAERILGHVNLLLAPALNRPHYGIVLALTDSTGR